MFENTLLIIKSDFMPRRKALLLHILCRGFQIQGNRKLAFTPEDAAEFNKDLADDKCYMLYVILLSKGTSEAFILTKESAVTDLLNCMVCYFGTSVEMDRNVHVSRNIAAAQREITFIFPNYIHEPTPSFDKHKFCKQTLMPPILSEIYDIAQNPSTGTDENWRSKLSNWLLKTNAALPHISNQCSIRADIGVQEKAQQTEPLHIKGLDEYAPASPRSSDMPSLGSSGLITSSSCISCTSFKRDHSSDALQPNIDAFEAHLLTCATKTMKETVEEVKVEEMPEEFIDYVNVYEYEDGQMDDETDEETRRKHEMEDGLMELDEGEGERPFDAPLMDVQVPFTEEGEHIVEIVEEPAVEIKAMGDVSEAPSVGVVVEEKAMDEPELESKPSQALESAAEPAEQPDAVIENVIEEAAEAEAEPAAVPEEAPPAAAEPTEPAVVEGGEPVAEEVPPAEEGDGGEPAAEE